jgi:hypothetical protein
MRYSPGSNDVRTEAEESSLLRFVTGKRLVKAELERLACAVVICKVIITYSYDLEVFNKSNLQLNPVYSHSYM